MAHYRPRTWRGPDDGKLVDFSQWRMRHSFEQEDIGAFVELLNSLSLSFGLGLLFIDNAETLCTEICQLDQASWSTKERRTVSLILSSVPVPNGYVAHDAQNGLPS